MSMFLFAVARQLQVPLMRRPQHQTEAPRHALFGCQYQAQEPLHQRGRRPADRLE